MTIKKLKSIDIINVLSDLGSKKLETTVKLPIIIGGGISVREDMIDEINNRLDIIIDKVEPARIKPVVKKCAFANDANIIGAIYHYLTTSK
ncbi:Uncharacterised protein [Catenibacterium mitsuokai]|nr:Uncharacterised protein [Catenibacterium mitsuokai]